MKKFWQLTWFPVVMAMVIAGIYGEAALASAKKVSQPVPKESVQSQIVGISMAVPGQENNISVEAQSSPILETETIFVATPALTFTPNPVSTLTSKPHKSSGSVNSAPAPTSTPTPIPQETVNVEIVGLSTYKVDLKENDMAFSVLQRASEENNFTLSYQYYGDLGAMINCISGVCGGKDHKYWMFYYNGQFSSVGASSQPVFANDVTTWKFE